MCQALDGGVTNRDHVTSMERRCALDAHPIDQGAVTAAKVHQRSATLMLLDTGVQPRRIRAFESD